jgi:hypothetical protein
MPLDQLLHRVYNLCQFFGSEQMPPLAGHTGEVWGGALSSDGKGLSSGEIEIAVATRCAKSSERVAAAAEASNPVSCDIVSTSVGESSVGEPSTKRRRLAL